MKQLPLLEFMPQVAVLLTLESILPQLVLRAKRVFAESDRKSLFPKLKQTTVGIHPAIGGSAVRFPVRPPSSFVSLFKTLQSNTSRLMVQNCSLASVRLPRAAVATIQ